MSRLRLPPVTAFGPEHLQLVEDLLEKWANEALNIANRPSACGSLVLTWAAAATSATTTQAHGLGVIPQIAIVTPAGGQTVASGPAVLLAATPFDATNIYVIGRDTDATARTGSVTCYWLAIG
jgi:hypothetical protein